MIDAETEVVGACMIDPQAYWRVADMLTADEFASDDCRKLFALIADLRKAGSEADAITIGEAHPGLAATALRIANTQGSSANIRGYAEWVLRKATERRVRAAGQRIAGLRGEDSLAEAQRIIGACVPRSSGAVKSIRDYLRSSILNRNTTA